MRNIIYNVMFKLYTIGNIKTSGRNLKNEFASYLDVIFYVLTTGIPWRAIKGAKLHFTTYHKFFQKLVGLAIFEMTYKILLLTYYKNDPDKIKNLFIDSTMIRNINGKDNTGKNPSDKNKNGNKITVLVNDIGIPISIHLATANVHDATLIDATVNSSIIKIIKSRIIGDKGYINPTVKNKLKRTANIKLIYPYRCNQKAKNTTFEKNLLNKRHIVENFFSWLKRNRRIQQRYDSKSDNYLNFIYLGLIVIISKKIF
ncbi:MAG: hypothetical protein Barrevirus6_6 [Barrevirus sp.]|uniref:Transposase IS4-like domain-containing protein n=1 Tax=Barrevirus sp. TaxID=2487763 RepID=A0A3G4ZPY9_9VIRU|nr:MAG: hypothetical protein Barrevirus6_6 [Barrevirus sp.]